MAAYVSNITIPSGEDFEQTFLLENVITNCSFELSNYTIYSHLKKHPESLTTAAVFNVKILNSELGIIQISLASSITSELRPGRYSYDVLVDSGIKKERVIEGSALVTGGVTKISCIKTVDIQTIVGAENKIKVIPVLGKLPQLDLTNKNDKYVLMYDAETKKVKFVNPDEVLSASSTTETNQPGLPSDFLDALDADLDNRIDIDAGDF